ncbi:Photosystem II protein Psb27 [uncultured Synechococcales cyanobacterium]|uniref:Photosystem II lipoprotein Psb27 n=1 Tax=uncultured Synechococcales cyanobacterium TaxID=1936017 RepID=A0A6J4UZH5_9CYAN|nr:Photosystem II protein Psb27 [uncultured Synechococcales cyanobacterium]
MMQRFLSRLFALALVVAIGLVGCSSPTNLSGNYRQDTLGVINSLRTAIELPDDAPDKATAQAAARGNINEFFSQYRRNDSVEGLSSFTTMRTALNSLAGHYNSYPNRPLPEKLKARLNQEFNQVEAALNREG